MFARSRALRLLFPIVFITAAMAGCSDGTAPGGGPDTGELALGGSFDANGEAFLLGVTDTLPGNPLVVELIGGGLTLDAEDEEVSLQVAIRNVGADIHPPVMIWLGDFVPGSVSVVNPDAVAVSGGLADLLPPAYGFDYSELLGEDGVLASGETSRSKPWVFHDPGLASFAFGARLDAGLAPGLARLGGRVWVDRNGNGQPDEGEPGWHGAPILVETPGGEVLLAYSDHAGRYGVPAETAGLYQVTCDFSIFDMFPPLFTTPNPLSVLIAPDAGGEPQSFLHADFGLHWGAGPGEPVVFTEAPPDSLHLAPWTLIEARIEEDGLGLQVGFSGCQPEHPWTLYICGGFMESNPVQVRAVLVHELEEECDAAFTRVLPFNLHPLHMAYEMAYGGSGTLLIQLVDFQGQVHTIEYYVRGKDEGK